MDFQQTFAKFPSMTDLSHTDVKICSEEFTLVFYSIHFQSREIDLTYWYFLMTIQRKTYTSSSSGKSSSSLYLKCCLFFFVKKKNNREFSFLVCREISENVESCRSNKKKYYILVGFSIYLTFLAVRSLFNVEDWNEISKLN